MSDLKCWESQERLLNAGTTGREAGHARERCDAERQKKVAQMFVSCERDAIHARRESGALYPCLPVLCYNTRIKLLQFDVLPGPRVILFDRDLPL